MSRHNSISTFLIGLLWSVVAYGQNAPLDSVKLLIAANRTAEALPVVTRLVATEPKNPHANYFLGLCHVRLAKETELAIPHLELAANFYKVNDIDPGMAEPELVWYYLVMAYSRTGQCAKAQEAFRKFMNVYSQDDDSYANDVRHWLELCYDPDRLKQELKVLVDAVNNEGTPVLQRLSQTDNGQRKVVTRDHGFTTRSTLYGVQVGAGSNPLFGAQFKGLRNVGVYLDENGVFRYVIGNLTFKSQAEKLLDEVHSAGYPDAFIVDISSTEVFQQQVVSIEEHGINERLSGQVEYRVQIGAFAEVIPERLAEVYLKVDGIFEHRERGLTTLQVGPFSTYDGAVLERDRLRSLGFDDAFVTAFNRGRRVPLRLAQIHSVEGDLVPQKRN